MGVKQRQIAIDRALAAPRESLADRRIQFHAATHVDANGGGFATALKPINGCSVVSHDVHTLKNGYVNGRTPCNTATANDNNTSSTSASAAVDFNDGLPCVKKQLYPRALVGSILEWDKMRNVGAGLVNKGNTCFLNASLQCLIHCPVLAVHMLSMEHSNSCTITGFCMFCALEAHTKLALSPRNSPLCPSKILNNMRHIARHFRPGAQEDAHEFMRYMIDALQKSCLAPHPKDLNHMIKETTLIHRIFGGYLRSQITCSSCQYQSNKFDSFLDISLDIKGCSSITRALHKFITVDRLEGDNKYMCSRCKKKSNATKQLTIREPPNILTLHLKRFDFLHRQGHKINKHVQFTSSLDLAPYLSNSKSGVWDAAAAVYDLFAVLVHSGPTLHCGHYYSYVRGSTGQWHLMNDQTVSRAKLDTVLAQHAYVLMYGRRRSNMFPSSSMEAGKSVENNIDRIDPSAYVSPADRKRLKKARRAAIKAARRSSEANVIPKDPTGHIELFSNVNGSATNVVNADQLDRSINHSELGNRVERGAINGVGTASKSPSISNGDVSKVPTVMAAGESKKRRNSESSEFMAVAAAKMPKAVAMERKRRDSENSETESLFASLFKKTSPKKEAVFGNVKKNKMDIENTGSDDSDGEGTVAITDKVASLFYKKRSLNSGEMLENFNGIVKKKKQVPDNSSNDGKRALATSDEVTSIFEKPTSNALVSMNGKVKKKNKHQLSLNSEGKNTTSQKTKSTPVEVIQWDAHVSHNESGKKRNTNAAVINAWDGSKQSCSVDVVKALTAAKFGVMGHDVRTWNGALDGDSGSNTLDATRAVFSNVKRENRTEMDDDIDRGHIKKVAEDKESRRLGLLAKPTNVFQKAQSKKYENGNRVSKHGMRNGPRFGKRGVSRGTFNKRGGRGGHQRGRK